MTPGAAIQRSAELRGGSLNPLPGRQMEVKAVSSVPTKQRWNVAVITQQNALEQTVKRVRNPRVLHVATHGFFESDPKRKQRELGDTRPPGLARSNHNDGRSPRAGAAGTAVTAGGRRRRSVPLAR
jgi:hypothetical protein